MRYLISLPKHFCMYVIVYRKRMRARKFIYLAYMSRLVFFVSSRFCILYVSIRENAKVFLY